LDDDIDIARKCHGCVISTFCLAQEEVGKDARSAILACLARFERATSALEWLTKISAQINIS
jgi:hypothetical protein